MKNMAALFLLLMTLSLLPLHGLAKEPKFVGSQLCKVCHKKKKLGQSYQLWEKSRHARAFDTLLTDSARAEARKAGITTPPEKSDACLVCHVTVPEAPKSKFLQTFRQEEGIGCESCHGPGSMYKKNRVMKKLRREQKQGGNKLAQKYEYMRGSASTCTDRCHRPEVTIDGTTYKNLSYKPFDASEAMKKIAHPLP